MIGHGAIPGSPKSKNFAGRTARSVSSGHKAASSTGASHEGCADQAPTPFFDLLTTMIEDHAAESGRALQDVDATDRLGTPLADIADAKEPRRTEVDAAPPAADKRWRAQQLNLCVVGLIVAIGNVIYVSEAGNKAPEVIKEQPALIAAADEALQARSVVIGSATASGMPMEGPLQAGEPGGSRTIGVEAERMDEGESEKKSTSGANSNDLAAATPVVGQPIEELGSDTDRADGAAEERVPNGAARTDQITPAMNAPAEVPSRRDDAPSSPEPMPSQAVRIDSIAPAMNAPAELPSRRDDAPSSPEPMPSQAVRSDSIAPATNASAEEPSRRDASPSPPRARKTRSAIGQTKRPAVTQVARVISGVNMRAGPNNGQPVLATIPRGSPVEVIKCQHWCEVIFAGQRGWVYKTFIGAPPADVAASPNRTRPSPRKAGSNSGMLRGSRTWALEPHRSRPAVRLSAGQSTQDAASGSQNSSGLWGAVEYLWNQVWPTALRPNSDR